MKNKTILKIGLIAVILIGILGVVWYYVSGLGTSRETVIAATDFEKYIQKRVDQDVKGKDYETARKNYQNIRGEVQTEYSVHLKNSGSVLSSEEASNCYKMLFYAYAPIFKDYATAYFDNPSWSMDELDFFKNHSETLLKSGLATNGSEIYNGLITIVNWVNGYKNALRVVRAASYCTSAAGVESIARQAQGYKKKPFTNNASLSAGLNGAYVEAKRSYAQSVISFCKHIAAGYESHSNYQSWYESYKRACSMVDIYTGKYGQKSMFSDVLDQLNNADSWAMSYYNTNNTTEEDPLLNN